MSIDVFPKKINQTVSYVQSGQNKNNQKSN